MDQFDFNLWLSDYQWDQYKAAKRQAEWEMYASMIGTATTTIGTAWQSAYYGGTVDVGQLGSGAADILRQYGAYQGFQTYVDPAAAAAAAAAGIPLGPAPLPGAPGAPARPATGGASFTVLVIGGIILAYAFGVI